MSATACRARSTANVPSNAMTDKYLSPTRVTSHNFDADGLSVLQCVICSLKSDEGEAAGQGLAVEPTLTVLRGSNVVFNIEGAISLKPIMRRPLSVEMFCRSPH